MNGNKMIIVIPVPDLPYLIKVMPVLILLLIKGAFMKQKIIMAIIIFMACLSANAHPGHGDAGGFTITHYLIEPEHLFTGICLLALLVSVTGTILGKRKKRYQEQANL